LSKLKDYLDRRTLLLNVFEYWTENILKTNNRELEVVIIGLIKNLRRKNINIF